LALNSAASGSTSVTSPPESSKPVGWFIQPFTEITIIEPAKPVAMIGSPASRWARGDRRSQP
jgi:hypothetical protein